MAQFNCSAVAGFEYNKLPDKFSCGRCPVRHARTHWLKREERYACTSMCTSTVAELVGIALFRTRTRTRTPQSLPALEVQLLLLG